MVVVRGQCKLLQIVAALRPACRLPRGLDCRQQQADEYRDNRDHHQELDQRKTFSPAGHESSFQLSAWNAKRSQKTISLVPQRDRGRRDAERDESHKCKDERSLRRNAGDESRERTSRSKLGPWACRRK